MVGTQTNVSAKRVVKQEKYTEQYQAQKLHNSICGACLSVREFTGSAQLTAERVVAHVEQWLEDKYEVTSNDLRRVAAEHLAYYNPAAAYVFATHNELN